MIAHRPAHAMSVDSSITEGELRKALVDRLQAAAQAAGYVVVEELGVEGGVNRIDVVVVGADMIGFELKSDLDTAHRLSTQIHAFNRVFDRMNLVVSSQRAPEYRAIVPSWWGLWVAARNEDGGVRLVEERRATVNLQREAYSIVSLLRSEEALAVAARYMPSRHKRVTKRELHRILMDLLSLDELAAEVSATLRSRVLQQAASR